MATPETYSDAPLEVPPDPVQSAEVIDIRTGQAVIIGETALEQVITEEVRLPVRNLPEHARALIMDSCLRRVHDGSLKPEEAMSIYNGYDPDHPMTIQDIYPDSI